MLLVISTAICKQVVWAIDAHETHRHSRAVALRRLWFMSGTYDVD